MRIQIMINVAYQSLLPSLWSTSLWSSEKPCIKATAARNGTLHLCFLYNFRLKTIRAAPRPAPARAPLSGVEGLTYLMYLMSDHSSNFNPALHFQSGVSSSISPTHTHYYSQCVHVYGYFMMMLHSENVRLGWSLTVAHRSFPLNVLK